jgi:hypothetical protein
MRTARLAASLVFAVGCSSGGSAGPQGTTDAGEAAAADAPSADAPTTEAGPEAGTPNLFIAWTGAYSTGVVNLLFANFSAAAGTRCATQSIAPSCYVIDCTSSGPVPAALSSGKLELYDGANVLLSATPNAQGIYPSTSSTTAPWKAGDSIGLRTAGDALPMFDVPLTACCSSITRRASRSRGRARRRR